jgi:hypothetical protein
MPDPATLPVMLSCPIVEELKIERVYHNMDPSAPLPARQRVNSAEQNRPQFSRAGAVPLSCLPSRECGPIKRPDKAALADLIEHQFVAAKPCR